MKLLRECEIKNENREIMIFGKGRKGLYRKIK